jgi:uncharacterized coiled-coil protein SlyX
VTDNDDGNDNSLAARLAAVERALTDGDPVADLSDAAELRRELDAQAEDLAAVTERVDALEATVQSLHGYVGEIAHVNERVERRADAARAAVERLDDHHPRSHQSSPHQSASQESSPHQSASDQASPHQSGTREPDGVQPDSDPGASTTPGAEFSPAAADGWTDAEEEDATLLDRLRSSL